MSWVANVNQERRDLREKIEHLAIFLSSTDATLLGSAQRYLMEVQLNSMRTYESVLSARLLDAERGN